MQIIVYKRTAMAVPIASDRSWKLMVVSGRSRRRSSRETAAFQRRRGRWRDHSWGEWVGFQLLSKKNPFAVFFMPSTHPNATEPRTGPGTVAWAEGIPAVPVIRLITRPENAAGWPGPCISRHSVGNATHLERCRAKGRQLTAFRNASPMSSSHECLPSDIFNPLLVPIQTALAEATWLCPTHTTRARTHPGPHLANN